MRDHHLVRTVGGHGWLLGDDGSGFWLGREAVRSVLRSLDLREPLGLLEQAVIRGLFPDRVDDSVAHREGYDALRDDVVRTVNSRPPVMLAELAPTVMAAYAQDDETAQALVKRAAELLIETVAGLRTTRRVLYGAVACGVTDQRPSAVSGCADV